MPTFTDNALALRDHTANARIGVRREPALLRKLDRTTHMRVVDLAVHHLARSRSSAVTSCVAQLPRPSTMRVEPQLLRGCVDDACGRFLREMRRRPETHDRR